MPLELIANALRSIILVSPCLSLMSQGRDQELAAYAGLRLEHMRDDGASHVPFSGFRLVVGLSRNWAFYQAG